MMRKLTMKILAIRTTFGDLTEDITKLDRYPTTLRIPRRASITCRHNQLTQALTWFAEVRSAFLANETLSPAVLPALTVILAVVFAVPTATLEEVFSSQRAEMTRYRYARYIAVVKEVDIHWAADFPFEMRNRIAETEAWRM